MTPLVSVVIPVYNTQDYLGGCIDSVLQQSFQDFEILCVDDGSTDRSADLIRQLMAGEPRIRLIQTENHGQGHARNLALGMCSGSYVLFLDSDDRIEKDTLSLAVSRAEAEQSDLVVFNWYYFDDTAQKETGHGTDAFMSEDILAGRDCRRLLAISPAFFTVNKLYRRSFLERHAVRYGEGYLYEDCPFWVQCAVHAEKVSLIDRPLYRITLRGSSSTKANCDTDIHYRSFICAVRASLDCLAEAEPPADGIDAYRLAEYFFQKFLDYFDKRVPPRYRRAFARDFLDAMSWLPAEDQHKNRMLSFCLSRKVFSRKRVLLFRLLLFYHFHITPRLKQSRGG